MSAFEKPVQRDIAKQSLDASEMQAAARLRYELFRQLQPYLNRDQGNTEQALQALVDNFPLTLVPFTRQYFKHGSITVLQALRLAFDRRPKRELDKALAAQVERLTDDLVGGGVIESSYRPEAGMICETAVADFWKGLVSGRI